MVLLKKNMNCTCNHCFLYVSGLLLAFAYDNMSYKKVAIQSHTYPGSGYDASKAVDGNMETCMRTEVIGSNSADKTVWWKVDLGGIYNIYDINILFKTYDGYDDRQRGRFAGFSLYVSNTDVSSSADIKGSTLCYKDGPRLPSLNFTMICMQYGRYVIYYNERLEGILYPSEYEVVNVNTELCEVKVQGCSKASFYGSSCDTQCPVNCKDSTCHIHIGSCFNCTPGWTGMQCNTKCREGWYGVNCKQQCVGYCREGTTCNHVTGQCDRGCDAEWTGYMCDKSLKECDDGTYGYNCVNNCSGHCLGDYPCNKETGRCEVGCQPGYTTGNCSKKCPPGYFGMECRKRCSGKCVNNEPCDHVTGVCLTGCQDGFLGIFCNNSCKAGHFGTNCSRFCSPNCKPDTCRHTNRWCICSAGWTGDNCSKECVFAYGENCRHPCNIHCINQTCDRFDGSCLHGCTERKRCDIDIENDALSVSSSNSLPITVGSLMCACILIIIGVVITILVIRQKSSNKKSNTSVHRVCFRSTPAVEESVNSENLSNYQELNFSLQENPYQSMSR